MAPETVQVTILPPTRTSVHGSTAINGRRYIYIYIYIYISINIGLGHLAWDMIWAPGPMWAHVGPWAPGPGALGPLSPQVAPPGPGPPGPRGPYHIPGKVSEAYID